jgi:hypothetical protein
LESGATEVEEKKKNNNNNNNIKIRNSPHSVEPEGSLNTMFTGAHPMSLK